MFNIYNLIKMNDIFEKLGIIDSDGNKLSEENLNPIMGYQICHKQTGRLLPQCQRYEIMGKDYAIKKMNSITGFYESIDEDFNSNEYELVPVYFNELDGMSGFILLYSEDDKQNI